MMQMTLFELEPIEDVDFNKTPEEEMVRIIGCAIGYDFKNKGWPWGWQAGDKKLTINVKYGNYKTLDERDGKRFISAGYDYHTKGQIGGAGGPCDSIEEAIEFLKKGIERWA